MRSDLSLAVVVQFDRVFLQLRHQVIGGHKPGEKVIQCPSDTREVILISFLKPTMWTEVSAAALLDVPLSEDTAKIKFKKYGDWDWNKTDHPKHLIGGVSWPLHVT